MTDRRPPNRGRARAGARALVAIAALLAALFGHACARRAGPGAWTSVEIPTDASFDGVWFSDSLNGWLTGGGWAIDGGIVGRTRDGGRSWRFQSGVVYGGGPGFSLGRVQFRDSLHGCAVGEHGLVILTDDGAESWRPARSAGRFGASLFDVQFIDDRNAWAIGPGSLVRTEDGGETWRLLVRSESENGYLSGNAIHFVDERHGWLVGQGGSLMWTEDGGWHWTPAALPLRPGERPTLRDVTFLGAERGWVVGEGGSIFHSEDGGLHWTRQATGVPVVRVPPKDEHRPREVVPELETEPDRLALTAVRFADANRGWAVGYYADVAESVVLGTHDGGTSWRVEHVQRGELLRSLFVLDAEHAWAAGDRARTSTQVVLRYAPGERR
jgi:photosystem II stability/assembly factor-like uncharacterized protein